ncbi:MAG: AarF/ABC1/UbiB kinase family protein [Oscillatoria sp. PMC 1068.18]|nr:AarF/ABC1/UbiB kinase family protein [Oscillatoria sp. PMC 1076.18]MEC4988613.1 AarF/ABC1/UbiB kinase family protein [Oscillatoria sp. PMC 1068.18]
MLSLTQNTSRQGYIIEVVLRNGWDYMRGLLSGSKANEPQLPPPEVLRNIFVELGPVYVKLGQLLSTRPDLLPPDYIEALTALQANVPPVPWAEIEVTIRKQLRQPLEEVFTEIDLEPVAAGSIAQIHRATLTNGQQVAMKVQRPGIDATVAQDISLIKGVADLVSRTDFGQDYDVVALANEFTSAIEAELDFTEEAAFTDQLRRNLSTSKWFDPKDIVVPAIYWDLTSEKLLVIEWLDGVPILKANVEGQTGKSGKSRKEEITTLLFRVFFQQLYIDGFFHADPHPGNLFYLRDGRIALIDCGMIGRLDPRTQQILTEMLLAVVDLDAQRCSQLTLELAESGQPRSLIRLENDYDRMLRKYHNRSLSQINFSKVFYELLQVARDNKIKLPGNMGLYAKSLANLEGVARSFNPEVNLLDEIKPLMTDIFRRQILGDSPLTTLLRTTLDLKSLSLQSPRLIELLLDRVTSETLRWNLSLRELEPLRRSLDDSANRLSFSILVGSLIMGAAMISTGAQTQQLSVISTVLFAAASFLGLWLIISILRSGRLR